MRAPLIAWLLVASTAVPARADASDATWAIEASAGLQAAARLDDYTARLTTFGFREGPVSDARFGAAVVRAIGWHLAVGVEARLLERRAFDRDTLDAGGFHTTQTFSWFTLAPGLLLRVSMPSSRTVEWFAQLSGGPTSAHTSYDQRAAPSQRGENHLGWHVSQAAGVIHMVWPFLGYQLQVGHSYAPTIGNLLEDVHDAGGVLATLGLRGAW